MQHDIPPKPWNLLQAAAARAGCTQSSAESTLVTLQSLDPVSEVQTQWAITGGFHDRKMITNCLGLMELFQTKHDIPPYMFLNTVSGATTASAVLSLVSCLLP